MLLLKQLHMTRNAVSADVTQLRKQHQWLMLGWHVVQTFLKDSADEMYRDLQLVVAKNQQVLLRAMQQVQNDNRHVSVMLDKLLAEQKRSNQSADAAQHARDLKAVVEDRVDALNKQLNEVKAAQNRVTEAADDIMTQLRDQVDKQYRECGLRMQVMHHFDVPRELQVRCTASCMPVLRLACPAFGNESCGKAWRLHTHNSSVTVHFCVHHSITQSSHD